MGCQSVQASRMRKDCSWVLSEKTVVKRASRLPHGKAVTDKMQPQLCGHMTVTEWPEAWGSKAKTARLVACTAGKDGLYISYE